jgi:tetratricopeptide (TPR) repeat protein
MGNSDSSPVYREIGYYSYDNVRGRMGRHLSCYHRCPSKYGVTKISYCCCRCDKKFTFYFNTSDGSEISGCRADEMENKNKEAEELNEEGDEFLKQENYEKAIEKYHSAYLRCTSGYSNEEEFTKKRDAAKMEWPKKLNLQGIELYNNNNFQEAINKFQKAFEVNQNENHKKTYIANKADCYKELGNYSEAIKLYNESLSLDNNYSHAKNGKACTMSKMGKDFFSTGNYVESLQHYQQAYQTCSNDYQYRSTFKSNAQKAQVEIEAFECYQRAESSIAQCNNLDSVISDYQNAFNKSEVQSQKNLYESKLQAAERIRMKLSDLDHFWDEAWEFELNERDEEAEKGFQKVKEKAAEYIKLFPYFKKFQEYSEKVDLKIEGNFIELINI